MPSASCLRLGHERREPAALETDEHVGGLHLGALAVRRLDLQRGVVVGEHGADLEVAFLFVENVHCETRRAGTEGMKKRTQSKRLRPQLYAMKRPL